MINMSLIVVLLTAAFVMLALGLYWLPSILGCCRRHPDLVSVVVVNALLGWTMIGWLVAFARALRPVPSFAAGYPAPPCLD